MKIQALISDIANHTPQKTDKFLIDSNVWLWMTYPRISSVQNKPAHYQITKYPTYIEHAIKNSASLYWSIYSVTELSHLLESFEAEIGGFKRDLKNFRKDDKWKNYTSQLDSTFGQIKGIAQELCSPTITIDEVMDDIKNFKLDSYDSMILKTIQSNDVTKIITDDSDFARVKDIQVFTANSNLIQKAKDQGRFY
jgi:predicted nucleic acid-binding protein